MSGQQIAVVPARFTGPGTPTVRDVLAIFFRQRRVLLISFLVILVLALVWTGLSPAYQAEMKFLITRERVDPVVSARENLPSVRRLEVTEEELNSEAELLRDRGLLLQVVHETDGAGDSGWRRLEDQEAREARAARSLASAMQVEVVRKTNLIRVSLKSANPALAARQLQKLADLYMDKHRRVHRPQGEARFFAQQALRSRERLIQAEAAISDFGMRTGIVSAMLERDLALQKLSEMSSSHRQTLIALADSEARQRALLEQLAKTPERATTQVRTSDNAFVLQNLRSTLVSLELKHTELLSKYQPSYRLVQEVEQQLAEVRAEVLAAERTPIHEEVTDKDPTHQWAQTELTRMRVEVDGLRARAQAASADLNRQYQRAQQLGDLAVRQQDLTRSAKLAEDSFLLYARKEEEGRVSDALDQGGLLNVNMAEQPAVPALPLRSDFSVLAWGLFIAMVGSAAVAVVSDLLDPALRTPQEVAACLGFPVLAAIPRGRLSGRADDDHERRRLG
jgi:protein tyrosine kinase modulator